MMRSASPASPPFRPRRGARRLAGLVAAALVGAVMWTTPAGSVAGFGDVPDGRFYTAPIQWMVDNDITEGVTPECFEPYAPIDRGQAAVFMWRMEGKQDPSAPHRFTDVPGWMSTAVSWMFEQEVTLGTTSATFSPGQTLTRAELVTFLWRLADKPRLFDPPTVKFTDVVPGAFYYDALVWAVGSGVTQGTTSTTFSPADTVTRGQVATFLYRYNGKPRVTLDTASPPCGGVASTGGAGGDVVASTGGGATGGATGGSYVNTYHVDRNHPAASDSNPGTESSPWRTVRHAAAVAGPGDRVLVKAGVYDDGEIEVERSGVTLSAYPGHERQAIIRGNGFFSRRNSDLTINGFRIEHTDGYGIRIAGPGARNITVTNNHTYDTHFSGISIRGVTGSTPPGNYDGIRDVTVRGNVLELNRNREMLSVGMGAVNVDVAFNHLRTGDPDGGGGDEGITFKEGVRDSRIYGNVAHGLSNKAISIDGGSSIHDPLVTDIEIFGNTLYDLPSQGMWITTEGRGDVDGVHVHHNVIHDADGNGILVYEHPGGRSAGGTVRNVVIEFNTVWRNGEHSGYGGIRVDHPSAPGVVIRDNIAWANNGYGIRGDNGTSISRRNLCQEASLCDVTGDPRFVNPPTDFGLASGSPAIGAGAGGADLGAR